EESPPAARAPDGPPPSAARTPGGSLGVAVWDYDEDGWPDLIVANDMRANRLYRNNRDGTFAEMGLAAGIAYGADGEARAGMGVDTGDDQGSGQESVVIG